MNRRVVVTGVGLVSPLGIGTEATWDGLCAGRSGVGPITKFDAAAFAARIAGEVKGFDPLQFVDKKDVKKMDIFIQYAIAASQFAVDDAGLVIGPDNADPGRRLHRVRASAGSPRSSASTRRCWRAGPRKISPFFIPVGHHQPGRRAGVDPVRRQGAEPGHRAPPARRRRMPSATPTRSSGAATPTR